MGKELPSQAPRRYYNAAGSALRRRTSGKKITAVGARSESVRAANLSTVLKTLISQDPHSTRAKIAASTGITRATVSRLIDDLISARLVTEFAPLADTTPGRPALPLRPARGTVIALGLEANIEYLAARVIDLSGRVISEVIHSVDLERQTAESALAALGKLATQSLESAGGPETRLAGIGLAVPGLVDDAHQRLLYAPNLRWHNINPLPLLNLPDHFASDFHLVNEANAAALSIAYQRPGLPNPTSVDFIFLSGEVGIGSALVMASDVMRGQTGWAGEIGHMCVDPLGPSCACGANGCLEQFIGLHALAAALELPAKSSLDLILPALSKNGASAGMLQRNWQALGQALASTVNMLGVPHVVLGGTLAELFEYLAPVVKSELSARVLSYQWAPVSLSPAPLGRMAAATGAAYSELNQVIENPAQWML